MIQMKTVSAISYYLHTSRDTNTIEMKTVSTITILSAYTIEMKTDSIIIILSAYL